MGDDAVAADGDDLKALAELLRQSRQARFHVFDIGAVGTEEQHQHGPAVQRTGGPAAISHRGQLERRQLSAQRQHGRGGQGHGQTVELPAS